MEMRNFEFRIYPSRKQIFRLENQFSLTCNLYNALLTAKREAYKTSGKNLTKFEMNKMIKQIKDSDPGFKQVHSQVLQNCSDRVDKAFSNFFRRAKEKESGKHIKVGYPRYKHKLRSITYPQSGFKFKSDKRLYISKVGNVPIVLHRLPRGKLKAMHIKHTKSDKWFVVFSCEISDTNTSSPMEIKNPVGIDVGIENFATLSDGTVLENPEHLIKSEKRLKRLQRKVSRKVKGSNNRRKAVHRLAVQHERVANQRKDFLHKTSRDVVNNHDAIAVEDLNINGMMKNHHLAKSIADGSWGAFLQMLGYKAKSAGIRFIAVNPSGTSQVCSQCGATVKKDLKVRIHCCPHCGAKLHRDLNAALNILSRAGLARINACGDHVRPSVRKAEVAEAGTTRGLDNPC